MVDPDYNRENRSFLNACKGLSLIAVTATVCIFGGKAINQGLNHREAEWRDSRPVYETLRLDESSTNYTQKTPYFRQAD